MGRPLIDIPEETVWDAAKMGLNQKEMAEMLDVSVPTMRRIIGKVQKEQGLIMKYRAIQSLQLTSLQARILDAITPEKIEEAPLRDLVIAFKVLKDKELVVDGKPSEIKGLVAHLIHLEKEKVAGTADEDDEIYDVTPSEVATETGISEGYTPEL